MHGHHVILILSCCILLMHCMMQVVSTSSLPSSESSPVIRIKTHGSGEDVSEEDLEFSDTSHGEVTNSDQQVVYINHGGGAVSSIRRSFAVPFAPHVSSYPSALFDAPAGPNSNSDPELGPEYVRDISDAGFARRAGAADEDRPFDGSFDDHNIDPPESFAPEHRDPGAAGVPLSHKEPQHPSHPPPPPLGLPVPPTGFGSRTPAVTSINHNINNNNIPVNHNMLHDHRIAEPDQQNQRINFQPPTPQPFNHNINPITRMNHNSNNNVNHNNNHHQQNNNINRINPLVNAFSPIASGFPQALNPDFFNLFDAPFAPLGSPAAPGSFPPPFSNNMNDNLFQRRRLSIQNTPNNNNEISHNSLSPVNGYPNYNYYAGNEEGDVSAKWPKIFKFTDGRINLYEFEKDKKIGRIKFSRDEDPLFDGVRRDSFLILHGGTYS